MPSCILHVCQAMMARIELSLQSRLCKHHGVTAHSQGPLAPQWLRVRCQAPWKPGPSQHEAASEAVGEENRSAPSAGGS